MPATKVTTVNLARWCHEDQLGGIYLTNPDDEAELVEIDGTPEELRELASRLSERAAQMEEDLERWPHYQECYE